LHVHFGKIIPRSFKIAVVKCTESSLKPSFELISTKWKALIDLSALILFIHCFS